MAGILTWILPAWAKKKPVRLVCFNTQTGSRGWELTEKAIQTPSDIVCLQRFPKKWLSKIKEPHEYQPAYPGADNGCLTLLRASKFVTKGNTAPTDFGKNVSQSTAYIVSRLPQFTVVNHIGPYPSEEEEVTVEQWRNHIVEILKRRGRVAIVGDMHSPDLHFAKIEFGPFKHHSHNANFVDDKGREENLTKLLLDFPAQVKESLLDSSRPRMSHIPILFEITL